MAASKKSTVPTCYATCSIGYDDTKHDLPAKLDAIAAAGFDAIELSMPDVLSYGKQLSGSEIDAKDYPKLCEVGKSIRSLCEKRGLKILMLQPFANFEGWPKGSKERQDAFERADGWSRIMEAVGTDMLQIGSSDSPGIVSSFDHLADDLRELADILSKKQLRICYENWCWATHAPDWQHVWDIVKKVDRDNVGLCLDTFQSAGGEWADPTTSSGLIEGVDGQKLDEKWKASCRKLSKTIPAEKIFILQISDAYKVQLKNKTDKDGLRPRGQWSHDYRPLPYDGGYLPVEDFTKAVFGTGFRGYCSIEVFDGKASEKYKDDMKPYAVQAFSALQKLISVAESDQNV